MTYFEKALNLLNEKKNDDVIETLKKGSEDGEYRCTYQLANMYAAGLIVARDEENANKYFALALEQANKTPLDSDALFIIGAISIFGLGKQPVDKEAGIKALNLAADKDNRDAMILLVNGLRNGQIMEKDFKRAFELAKRLYEMKLPIGGRLYAESFYFSLGVEQDYAKAFKYYKEAADLGDVKSIFSIGTCYYEGKGVEKDDKTALAYFLKAAQAGYPDAMRNLAYFYNKGISVEQSFENEILWLERLASINDPEGMYSLACAYVDKSHRKFKYVEAIDLLRKASARNNVKAKIMLGHVYEFGQFGALPQPNLAFEQYNSAYTLGFAPAAFDLLRCYRDGVGVRPDQAKASEMQKVVEQLEGKDNPAAA